MLQHSVGLEKTSLEFGLLVLISNIKNYDFDHGVYYQRPLILFIESYFIRI